jgi:hypothetical protein
MEKRNSEMSEKEIKELYFYDINETFESFDGDGIFFKNPYIYPCKQLEEKEMEFSISINVIGINCFLIDCDDDDDKLSFINTERLKEDLEYLFGEDTFISQSFTINNLIDSFIFWNSSGVGGDVVRTSEKPCFDKLRLELQNAIAKIDAIEFKE